MLIGAFLRLPITFDGISSICFTNLKLKNKMTKLVENNPQGTANIADDRVLATGHFKCSDCQHKKRYTTGRDEYPGLTTIEYCSKEHWEGGDPEPEPNQDFTVRK